jgi:hypothetical protein
MSHQPFTPPDLPGVEALQNYLIGVKDRVSNPLNALAKVSQQAMDDPMGTALNISNPIGSIGAGLFGHTVYHGSPHLFDKFDMKKIGTGEGAQAYGHGLYFAENPAVAGQYKDTNVFRAFDIAPEAEKRGLQLTSAARGELIRQAGANPDPMIAAKKLQYANATTRDIPQEKLADLIDGYQKAQSGQMYKVDIPDHTIPKMLDWDKPLSEQSPEVQKAFNDLATNANKPQMWPSEQAQKTVDVARLQSLKGDQLYKFLNGHLNVGDQGASQWLANQGVTGIRYLDGGSRNTSQRFIAQHPQGGQNTFNTQAELNAFVKRNPEYTAQNPNLTSNYVIFDDQLPKILERNGQPLTSEQRLMGGKE